MPTIHHNAAPYVQATLWGTAMIATALLIESSAQLQKLLLLLVVLSTTSILSSASKGKHSNACDARLLKPRSADPSPDKQH